ncbi:hypothetical protein M5K25_021541 [Dendrobium thyrsiflorum]|uniref:Reverse transcriptase zinc-binding domain-containing protein n=1 Tax=Dendrobium thyrsiflorum TaxID=117978 RepID=A0ABD0UCP2_DENTH
MGESPQPRRQEGVRPRAEGNPREGFLDFWNCLIEAFSQPNNSSPLSSFYYKLKTLKNLIKHKPWNNSNHIQTEIDNLLKLQNMVITQIQNKPLDTLLNSNLNTINTKLAYYHSTLTNAPQAAAINDILHVNQSLTPLKYLGLPIFYRKLKLHDFQPLLQKISTYLDGWKAKTLSFAGRIQYLKFTISNTLAYWIRGSIIPKGCCKLINRLCSRFLYFGNTNARKLHTISWKDTTIPKTKGGLGIPSIDSLYHNFGCSIIWRFLNSNNLLFIWWRSKYYSLWKPMNAKNSQYWNYLCNLADKCKHCITLIAQPNSNLSLLWDPWCNGSSIADILNDTRQLNCYSPYFSWEVANIIVGENWVIPSTFEAILVSKIQEIQINAIEDKHTWLGTSNPNFYNFSSSYHSSLQTVSWHHMVWHKKYALRYSATAWMAFKGGLKTADILNARGIISSNTCCFCHLENESMAHLFFECSFTFNIIKKFLPWLGNLLMKPNLFQVFDSVLDQGFNASHVNYYLLTVCASIYFSWRARNDRIFGGILDCQNTEIAKIKHVITLKTSNWKDL